MLPESGYCAVVAADMRQQLTEENINYFLIIHFQINYFFFIKPEENISKNDSKDGIIKYGNFGADDIYAKECGCEKPKSKMVRVTTPRQVGNNKGNHFYFFIQII